jgi:hypothetical protein
VFNGPTFVLPTTVHPTDLLNLTAVGQVFLQIGDTYGTNAAGVLTTAGSEPVGGTSMFYARNFGSLLLGNTTIGYQQLFHANTVSGMGAAAPPKSLTLTNVSLSSVGFNSSIPAGTALRFLTTDGNTYDNSGSFLITGFITTADVEMPEPSSVFLIGAGLIALGIARRRFTTTD